MDVNKFQCALSKFNTDWWIDRLTGCAPPGGPGQAGEELLIQWVAMEFN